MANLLLMLLSVDQLLVVASLNPSPSQIAPRATQKSFTLLSGIISPGLTRVLVYIT